MSIGLPCLYKMIIIYDCVEINDSDAERFPFHRVDPGHVRVPKPRCGAGFPQEPLPHVRVGRDPSVDD